MVVCVPSYHNLSIVKPVNVQILVEYQGKRCEPHSFTYVPMTKQLPAKVECETPIKSEVSIDDIGPSACIQTKPPAEVANLPCSTPGMLAMMISRPMVSCSVGIDIVYNIIFLSDDSNQDSKFEHSVKGRFFLNVSWNGVNKKSICSISPS